MKTGSIAGVDHKKAIYNAQMRKQVQVSSFYCFTLFRKVNKHTLQECRNKKIPTIS